MEFLKVLWNNLRGGPVTEAFPFGEAEAPKRFRGRVVIDPKLCVGCGTCTHVCVADAINISHHDDEGGFEITVWRNSCCLCGQCRHYCPTKAVSIVNDWHSAHRAERKYTFIERANVRYNVCESCGAHMRFLPHEVLEKIYADHPEVNILRISRLCPDCRRIEQAVAEERACHIDFIERLTAENQACRIDFPEQQAQLGLVCLLPAVIPQPEPMAAAEAAPAVAPVPEPVSEPVQEPAQKPVQEPVEDAAVPPVSSAPAASPVLPIPPVPPVPPVSAETAQAQKASSGKRTTKKKSTQKKTS